MTILVYMVQPSCVRMSISTILPHLLWRLMALLFILAEIPPSINGCPESCACFTPSEVHCAFRYLSETPGGINAAVKRINLGYNSLLGVKMNDFSDLKQLELLMLHGNMIKTIEDSSFRDLISLQVLKMSYNKVEKLNKDTFKGLNNLVRLHMDNNLISFIHPESFYGLKMLQLINLEGNQLQQLHPDTFITLRFGQILKWSSFKTIYLSDNALRTLPATLLSGSSQIENLFLSGNPWSCDCRMSWLTEWIKKHPAALRCKRDKKTAKDPCPICEQPLSTRGKKMLDFKDDYFTCSSPWIHSHLKQRNSTSGNNDYPTLSWKDFVAPFGTLQMNLTDQLHHNFLIPCVVQRPTKIENITAIFGKNAKDTLNATISTLLVCNIDYDIIQEVWDMLAAYSDYPMTLERGLSLTPTLDTTYTQVVKNDEDIFTEINAKIQAYPEWLLQDKIELQLDRVTTSFPTITIKYSSNVQVGVSKESGDQYSWTMIKRDNQTKTEHLVISGGATELNCQASGQPKPVVKWIFPDGSKLRSPYNSEDQRILITQEGRLILKHAQISDTGVYNCIATNYQDADVLAFRVTVVPADIEEEDINGIQVSHSLGQNLGLDCTTVSSPQASIQWLLPDHTVLDKSHGNRELHINGTLEIQSVTSRDSGFYRCLAANFLGTDLLSSYVTIFDNDVKRSTTLKPINEPNNNVIQIIDESFQEPDNLFPKQRVSEESRRIITGKQYPWPQSRYHNIPIGRRWKGRNSRIVSHTMKEVSSLVRNSQNNGGRKNLHNLAYGNAGSGDDISEDEFIVMTTTQGLDSEIANTIKDTEIPRISTTVNNNLFEVNPESILEANEKTKLSANQTPVTPVIMSYTLSSFRTQRNTRNQKTTKSENIETYSVGPTIKSDSARIHPTKKPVTLKPFMREVSELLFSGDLDDTSAGSTTVHTFRDPNITYLEPHSKTIFTAVTTAEGDQEKITFETTQRIKSELLPGSTIISKHQIQIVPSKRIQSGKRHKFHGQRRIIRPSKIEDIQSLLNKFKHLTPNKGDNHTFSENTEKVSDCDKREMVKYAAKCTTKVSPSLKTSSEHITIFSSLNITEKPSMTGTEKSYLTSDSKTMVHPESEVYRDFKKFNAEMKGPVLTTTNSTDFVSPKIAHEKTPRYTTIEPQRQTYGKPQNTQKALTTKWAVTPASTTLLYKSTTLTPTPVPTTNLRTYSSTTPSSKDIQDAASDDLSGSSSFTETDFPYILTPSRNLDVAQFPFLHDLSTTAKPTEVFHALPTPPTINTQLKQDLPNFSRSPTRLREKQKPGVHRRGFRRRKPFIKTTITAMTERPDILPTTQTKESVESQTKTTVKSKQQTTVNSQIQVETSTPSSGSNIRSTTEHVWRFTTQKPLTVEPTIHKQLNKRFQQSTTTKPQKKKVTSLKGIGSTAYPTPFPYTSHTAVNLSTYKHSTRLETSSSRQDTSKPVINGGKAASFTVLSNSDALLPCEATGNPEPIITWNRYTTAGTMMTIKGKMGKFEVLKNGTLLIQRTNIKDHGQYICVAMNENGSEKLVVTLSVVAYPTRILETKMRDLEVIAGKTVHLECRTEGRPEPVVSWILPNHTEVRGPNSERGRVQVSSVGTLTIQEVSLLDQGAYKCLASNPAGTDTANVNLLVVGAPPVILEEKQQEVNAYVGQNLVLTCTTQGDPKPTTHWVLPDGSKLLPQTHSNKRVSVFKNGTVDLRNVVISRSGKYECVSTNLLGSEHRVVILSVKRKEIPPRIINIPQFQTVVVYGGLLHLNCSAIGDPRPQIQWRLPSKAIVDQSHRMSSRIKVLENGSLIVASVNEKDAGNFLCVARNKVGEDIQLFSVSIAMKPARIEPKVFGKKQVLYGNDLKVDCVAAGVPIPEISWGLPDGTMVNSALQADGTEGEQFKRYILFDNGTLLLNKVGTDEEGDYTCYAENKLGKDQMHIHISVLSAAPQIQHPEISQVKVKPGRNVRFDCKATGEPKPKILWMLPSKDIIAASNERYLVHANGSLDIRNIKLADVGEYVCMARNSAGEDNNVYKLNIEGNSPIINGFHQNRTAVKDTAIKYSRKLIDCEAEGTPTPKITWIMPDNIFLTAPYYGSRINVHSNGTLEIRNVRPSDTAEFICIAQNDGGEAVMLVQLEVIDKLRRPIFKNPFNEKVVAKAGRAAVLNCSADGQPKPEILWTLPNRTIFTGVQGIWGSKYQLGKDGMLVIYNSTAEDTGKYRCAAKNMKGYIEKLVVFEVIQKPYILTRPKGIIRALSGESLFLHCLTDGVKTTISWSIPGGLILAHTKKIGRYTLMENGTLVVHATTMQDRGNYVCRAKNDVGEAVLAVSVLIIAHPARITNGPPPTLKGVSGVPVQLKCVAYGTPAPDIIWELPDNSVLTTGKGKVLGSEHLHAHGTLIIRKPTVRHSGNYKCIAFNYLGRDTRTTLMTIM